MMELTQGTRHRIEIIVAGLHSDSLRQIICKIADDTECNRTCDYTAEETKITVFTDYSSTVPTKIRLAVREWTKASALLNCAVTVSIYEIDIIDHWVR